MLNLISSFSLTKSSFLILFVIVCLFGISVFHHNNAYALTRTWDGTTDSDGDGFADGDGTSWDDQYNWNPVGVPDPADDITIGPVGGSGCVVSANNISITGTLTIREPCSLSISTSLTNSGIITISRGAAIRNFGTTTNYAGATISNSGTITNNSGVTINNSGAITINNSGTITNNSGAFINNSGTINNSGIINSLGNIIHLCGGVFNNFGLLIGNAIVDGCGIPPSTFIVSVVDAKGKFVKDNEMATPKSITFSFTGTDDFKVVNYLCSLDSQPPTTCSSSITYSNLSKSTHTFSVASVDAFANVDPTPATWTWKAR